MFEIVKVAFGVITISDIMIRMYKAHRDMAEYLDYQRAQKDEFYKEQGWV